MRGRPQLRALAERAGILASYRADDGATRNTPDATAVALLAAMGVDASSEAAARDALRDWEQREARRILEPVQISAVDGPEARRVRLRLPPRGARPDTWHLTLRDEQGAEVHAEGRVAARGSRLALPLPAQPTAGYCEIELTLEGGRERSEARQRRIVVPRRCAEVRTLLGGEPAFGLTANLYTLRSERNWGVGDLGDLAELLRFATDSGAAFVGVSPLHFLWNRGHDVSPYAPVSRLYRNPIYLDIERIPEFAESEAARQAIAEPGARARLEAARRADRVDYDAISALKREILKPLHRTFAARHRNRPTPRGRAYARYLEEQGDALRDFATYVALAERFSNDPGCDWRRWPGAYRDARSAEVERFRRERPECVDFHRYVQFEIDRQLAACAHSGREAARTAGLLQDLALGSTAAGADAWMFPEIFAPGVRIGAPPDAFNADGQDWGLPPLDPHRMRDHGYDYWIRLLRASCRHARALRIDHAMALTRLFWIPPGLTPRDGAYVRYPLGELLGILALESQRHATAVIGEDLGTVPRGFAGQLARAGVLSWRVLYFERRGRGFRPAHAYSRRALVTANTHDLPPLIGFARGRDLELRRHIGAIPNEPALADARAERGATCRALARRLSREGILETRAALPSAPALCAAVNAFLCRTPAPLVGISLDDLAGETEPVNLPGISAELFPSWRRRMRLAIESLRSNPGVRLGLRAVASRRRS
jgi:4-alpha-glucanotransferase